MNKRVMTSLLVLPLAISTAYAQDTGLQAVKVSGFGTGALTWADTDKAEFARPNQAQGSSKDFRTGIDSNLGLQADLPVNSWLSVTAQGLVRKDAEENYGAELSWAFAKARVSDEVSVRVGRIGLPVFMISDYRNVGYANTMLRPPAEVYSQVPFNSVDGADVTWQHGFGDTSVTAQLAYGNVKSPISGNIHVRGKELAAVNVSAEHGPFTVRAGHATGKITIDDSVSLNTLVGGLRAAAAGYRFPELAPLAAEIEAKDKRAHFSSLGLSMDWNNIVVQTEFAKRKSETYINDTSSWYVMGGYRIGKFLPYVTHSKLKIDSAVVNTVRAACPAGFPAACTPTMQALGAGVRRLPNTGVGQGEQSTNTIGVRWDFASSVALKAQVDRIKPKNGNGLFINVQPGFNDTVTVGAVALDFVF
ncbi:porin [Telluria aromaticivorans]|uniref:Porin n=1 Tax=Telluria aromaticivorans TaxID=2725995 RepID=A0A7Y2K2B3_9BURK|nr:porin [Telluria aromaticivorans]NNG25366.1 porin [Telluria aromaticivorans]